MEDITAALCLDNRLRWRLYPTPLANRGSHGISVYIHPIPSSSSFSPSLPNSFRFCPPVLPLISHWYSVSANAACLQGGHQIHYQVGQQFPLCLPHTAYYSIWKEEREEIGGSCSRFINKIMRQLKYKSNTTNSSLKRHVYCIMCKICRHK